MRAALARHDAIRARGDRGSRRARGEDDGRRVPRRVRAPRTTRSTPRSRRKLALAWRAVGRTGRLRVRMGLHAGEATERDGDWFGSEVNRAARVMAVGARRPDACARGVVGEQVRERVELVDLGEHRLRDLQSAVHLFQVEVPGAAASVPAVAVARRVPLEPAVRAEQLRGSRGGAARRSRIGMRSSRVVSIVGVGGVGKTRSGVAGGFGAAAALSRTVCGCASSRQVLDPDDLPDAVAAAVGYVPPQGVSVAEGLPRFLERKELVAGPRQLRAPRRRGRGVRRRRRPRTRRGCRCSATSREALGVRGEHISPLASLAAAGGRRRGVGAGVGGGRVVRRPCRAKRAASSQLDDTNARAVHDLCASPRRDPSGDRAGRGADEDDDAERDPHPPRPAVPAADRRSARRAWNDTRRCAPRSTGPTTCSATTSGRFSTGCRCAWVASISTPRSRSRPGSARTSSTRSSCSRSLVAKSLVERNERDGVTRYRLLEMIRQYAAERLNATDAARDRPRRSRPPLSGCWRSRSLSEARTPADYDALERLETETPNIAAAGRWLLADDRVAELVAFFDDLPVRRPRSRSPATTIDELGAIAVEVVERSDAPALPGYPAACYLAGVHEFWNGNNAEYRRLTELAAAILGRRNPLRDRHAVGDRRDLRRRS